MNSHPNSRIIALSAAFAMLGVDQLTKHWALVSFSAVGTTIELVGPIDLTLVLNRSNAFGLIPVYGEFSRWAFTALNLSMAVILLRFVLRKSTSTLNAFGFALVSAGALGNALDRLRLGAVVDFRDEFYLAATVQNLKTFALRTLGPPPDRASAFAAAV